MSRTKRGLLSHKMGRPDSGRSPGLVISAAQRWEVEGD